MTETLLDEGAVSEIEAILDGDDFEAKYIAASIDNLAALCRTVRHLLTENAQDYYLGDNRIYEDDLPRGITKALYDQWFEQSCVADGVRIGPSIERKSASFDALCATVKHLRERLAHDSQILDECEVLADRFLHDENALPRDFPSASEIIDALLKRMGALRAENKRTIEVTTHAYNEEREDLQSQLEQLRTGRDYWRTRAAEASKAAEKWYHERY